MEYLERTLRIRVKYTEWRKKDSLPHALGDRYSFKVAWLDDLEVLFMSVNDKLSSISDVKKHIKIVKSVANVKIVLVLKNILARQRQYLIEEGIAFIVQDKQIYLPFLGIVLQEKFDKPDLKVTKLMPSAQMLLLYYIYRKEEALYMNDVVKALGYSAMTISRAAKQLEEINLFTTTKEGVLKILIARKKGKDLFVQAKPYLTSPVIKEIFVSREKLAADMVIGGLSALSYESKLNPPTVATYATAKGNTLLNDSTSELIDANKQIHLEIWSYDPAILAKHKIVDLLSLQLSLENDRDERVQNELAQVVEAFWKAYYG